jgi:hypothetical protein
MAMQRILSVLAISVVVSAPAAVAETKTAKPPEEIIREGAERIMEGVRAFIQRLPQYLPPEILPNGDVIIRRLPPGDRRRWPHSRPEPEADGIVRT